MQELQSKIIENLTFVLEFMAVVVAIVLFAYVIEKLLHHIDSYKGRIFTTRKIAMIGLFSAISAILMMFEFPVPFAPTFYKLDFSELPVLIVTFAFGPVAGVLTEFCKICLKVIFRSTSTAFVGELANFVVGCSFILPAGFIYIFKKTKVNALIGCVLGTIVLTVFGSAFNGLYLLPTFASLYGMSLDSIIGMGTSINASITSVTTFVIFAVAPLNLIKGAMISILTLLIYKKISPILKSAKK